MKNYIITGLLIAIAIVNVKAQSNNVQLLPASGNICSITKLSLGINGNSFNPQSYLWSTGETSSEIEISSSGTYTLTVTGYHGSSSNLVTITKSRSYNVLPVPVIIPLTDLWVCKGDTVKLAAVSGYDFISWSNGAAGQLFQKRLNLNTPGTPGLDTMNVSYVATINNVCSVKSNTVLLRSIRKPNGVGAFYQGKMNIKTTDSIPAGLVTEYLYPVTYQMTFTDNANPLNIIKYVTAPGSRRAPANLFAPGATYTVSTVPVINGKEFCAGIPSTIGILATSSGNRVGLDFTEEDGLNNFKIYDIQGRMIIQKQGEKFDSEWLQNITPQMLIIVREGQTTEVTRIQIVK